MTPQPPVAYSAPLLRPQGFPLAILATTVVAALMISALAYRRPIRRVLEPKHIIARSHITKYVNGAFPQWAAKHKPGACPKSLRELDCYLGKASRNDPWGREYLMTCGDGRLYVMSLGVDGKANTADDIWSNQ